MKLSHAFLVILILFTNTLLHAERIETKIEIEEISQLGIRVESHPDQNLKNEWITILIDKKAFRHTHEVFISKTEKLGMVWVPLKFIEFDDRIEVRNLALPSDSLEEYRVHIRDDLASGTFIYHETVFSLAEAIQCNPNQP